MAGWQSGHAAACKAVYAGSIPTPASILIVVHFGSCRSFVAAGLTASDLLRCFMQVKRFKSLIKARQTSVSPLIIAR